MPSAPAELSSEVKNSQISCGESGADELMFLPVADGSIRRFNNLVGTCPRGAAVFRAYCHAFSGLQTEVLRERRPPVERREAIFVPRDHNDEDVHLYGQHWRHSQCKPGDPEFQG